MCQIQTLFSNQFISFPEFVKVCKGEKGCAAVGGTKQWKNDKYCDDVNNNEACGWDGGDCCNNSNANWSRWCYVSLLIYNGDIVFSSVTMLCQKKNGQSTLAQICPDQLTLP